MDKTAFYADHITPYKFFHREKAVFYMQDLKVILQGKKTHTELCSNNIVVKVVGKSVLKSNQSPLNSSKTDAKTTQENKDKNKAYQW